MDKTANIRWSILLGNSSETSDFVVDCLSDWWQKNQVRASAFDEWLINLDDGSVTRSNLTQFIKRLIELSLKIGLKIRLVYYPPYLNKYNPIERYWAALENYWHGRF